jgi:hypothetical protein
VIPVEGLLADLNMSAHASRTSRSALRDQAPAFSTRLKL